MIPSLSYAITFSSSLARNYYHFNLFRVFRTSDNWWSFTRVWVTANFLKSPGIFSVSYQSQPCCSLNSLHSFFLISRPFSFCTNPLVTVPGAPITICITVAFMFHGFSFSSLARSWYLSLFSFSFILWSDGTAKSPIQHALFPPFFFFWLIIICLVIWPKLGNPFVPQNLRKLSASHFPGRILGCAYTIYLYGQIQASSPIPSWSPHPTSRV